MKSCEEGVARGVQRTDPQNFSISLQAPWLTSIYDPDTFLPHTRRPSVCLSLDPSASATLRRQHVGAQDAHHQPTLGRQAHSHAIFHARTGRLERRLVRCGTDALAAPLALARALRAAQCAHPARHAQHGHAHAFVSWRLTTSLERKTRRVCSSRQTRSRSSSRAENDGSAQGLDGHQIPSERIVVGGFSQGGRAIALLTGLTNQIAVAGVAALSTWLPLRAKIAALRAPTSKNLKVFQAHGDADQVVKYDRNILARAVRKALEPRAGLGRGLLARGESGAVDGDDDFSDVFVGLHLVVGFLDVVPRVDLVDDELAVVLSGVVGASAGDEAFEAVLLNKALDELALVLETARAKGGAFDPEALEEELG
ncbi:hypothetical protein L1887_58080 [Cichorium endivia]|nr:hypothetical protein L1887_58080 [Cichorium endivia]